MRCNIEIVGYSCNLLGCDSQFLSTSKERISFAIAIIVNTITFLEVIIRPGSQINNDRGRVGADIRVTGICTNLNSKLVDILRQNTPFCKCRIREILLLEIILTVIGLRYDSNLITSKGERAGSDSHFCREVIDTISILCVLNLLWELIVLSLLTSKNEWYVNISIITNI